MGLSGRKIKQRIGADPRNLTWADDASKFGSAYLSKFGWDASQGLGAGGDGRTSHIKVAHKLDMLGIGAANARDPNGIAWKQNRDFESVLRRLNEQVENGEEGEEEREGGVRVEGFVSEKAKEEETVVEEEQDEVKDREGRRRKKDKKDKKDKGLKKEKKEKEKKERGENKDEGEELSEKAKKRKRKDGGEKKPKKQKTSEDNESNVSNQNAKEATPAATPAQPALPRHRAHRARAIAAKKMAAHSAVAISEILGIAPTPSTASTSVSASGAVTPQGRLTSLDDGGNETQERITTSTKSVADYFKEKLLSKSAGKSGTVTPSIAETDADAYDAPRGGLGTTRIRMEESGISIMFASSSSSNVREEIKGDVNRTLEADRRRGKDKKRRKKE